LLAVKVCLPSAFVRTIALGLFPAGDAPPALLIGFAGKAIENAVQRVQLRSGGMGE
jgi:hypothetical protein